MALFHPPSSIFHPRVYPSSMLVRAERRNTQRLNSSAIVTTTPSSPRLIQIVQLDTTKWVGSKCTTDLSSRRLQIKLVNPKPAASATSKPTTNPSSAGANKLEAKN